MDEQERQRIIDALGRLGSAPEIERLMRILGSAEQIEARKKLVDEIIAEHQHRQRPEEVERRRKLDAAIQEVLDERELRDRILSGIKRASVWATIVGGAFVLLKDFFIHLVTGAPR